MTDDIITRPRTRAKPKVERPKLYKVILLNDDYTPREFVVRVLKAEFRVSEDQAHRIMITAHRRGVCVVAVFTRDVAETKATRATDAGKAAYQPERKGFCYSDGFSNEIKDVSELDKDDFGPAVEKGWLVTFEITPRNVQDWVKNPELLGKASRAKLEDLTQPQVERVKLLKLRGEEGYKLVAPTLSIEHGIYFDQGWRP